MLLITNLELSEKKKLCMTATLAAGYIAVMNSEKENSIFMLELKECSKRIYEIPKFMF